MGKLNNILNEFRITLVLFLTGIGSIEDFHWGTFIFLMTGVFISVAGILFMKAAIREYAMRIRIAHIRKIRNVQRHTEFKKPVFQKIA